MLSAIILVGVGILIGWNLPQPSWAADLQAKAVAWFNSIKG